MSTGIGRNLSSARQAYANGDAATSRQAHERRPSLDEEPEQGHVIGPPDALKHGVAGGVAGVLLSVSVLVTFATLGLAPQHAIAVSFSTLLGVSVAVGLQSIVNRRRDRLIYVEERNREQWELSNFKSGEIAEMIDLYVAKGLGRADATVAINAMAKYPQFFVDVMMSQELELPEPVKAPCFKAILMTTSAAIAGSAPIAGFAVAISLDSVAQSSLAVVPQSALVAAWVCGAAAIGLCHGLQAKTIKFDVFLSNFVLAEINLMVCILASFSVATSASKMLFLLAS